MTAENDAKAQKGRAEEQKSRAEEEKTRAEKREQIAIDAIRRFGDVVRDTPELKNDPALAPLRAKLLKEPQTFFRLLRDRLQGDKETTSESLTRLAAASFDLGGLTFEIGDRLEEPCEPTRNRGRFASGWRMRTPRSTISRAISRRRITSSAVSSASRVG